MKKLVVVLVAAGQPCEAMAMHCRYACSRFESESLD
jgi:hypothetical protein